MSASGNFVISIDKKFKIIMIQLIPELWLPYEGINERQKIPHCQNNSTFNTVFIFCTLEQIFLSPQDIKGYTEHSMLTREC
jgi:hypothetical protein